MSFHATTYEGLSYRREFAVSRRSYRIYRPVGATVLLDLKLLELDAKGVGLNRAHEVCEHAAVCESCETAATHGTSRM